jgi:uncharacterized protein (DUF2336 family)
MVAYHDFVALSQSGDSEERGQAAHLAAMAYVGHVGPADEHAALYAALIGFLDDPSVRVRGALAYGLLHAEEAPRPIIQALLQDSPVIARAVAQYSPVLVDADLMGIIRDGDAVMLFAVAQRGYLSQRVAEALLQSGDRAVRLKLLERPDTILSQAALLAIAETQGINDAELRGALLGRDDLPGEARLILVGAVATALRSARIVKGAVAVSRLERLLRDAADTALTAIGEREAAQQHTPFVAQMVERQQISTRVMLHALVQGHVLFFAECVAELAGVPRSKIYSLLQSGSRAALNALFARSGLADSVRNLLCRLIAHARTADLADDLSARHYVVTALTEELLAEYGGQIPADLEDAFSYLSEQNVILARRAARGVMSGFASGGDRDMSLPMLPEADRRALPAA